MFSVIKSVWQGILYVKTLWFRAYYSLESKSRCLRQGSLKCLHCVCVEPRLKGRDIKEPHQQHFRSIVCPYSSRHAKVEKTAVHTPSSPALPFTWQRTKRGPYLFKENAVCYAWGGGVERKTGEKCNLRVTLKILFLPLSTFTRMTLTSLLCHNPSQNWDSS